MERIDLDNWQGRAVWNLALNQVSVGLKRDKLKKLCNKG